MVRKVMASSTFRYYLYVDKVSSEIMQRSLFDKGHDYSRNSIIVRIAYMHLI